MNKYGGATGLVAEVSPHVHQTGIASFTLTQQERDHLRISQSLNKCGIEVLEPGRADNGMVHDCEQIRLHPLVMDLSPTAAALTLGSVKASFAP